MRSKYGSAGRSEPGCAFILLRKGHHINSAEKRLPKFPIFISKAAGQRVSIIPPARKQRAESVALEDGTATRPIRPLSQVGLLDDAPWRSHNRL
ncbi:hypothetical protein K443DRAFT_679232, partial [Laccaria amethystina LaAM-08-1]